MSQQITLARRWLWFALSLLLILFLMISTALTEPKAHHQPTYPMVDLTMTLSKEQLSADDYHIIYQQTGLGKPAVDELRATDGTHEQILLTQQYFFAPIAYICQPNSPISREESVINSQGEYASATLLAPVHDGDILITSCSHTFGWRNGHAALVVDANDGQTLESVVLGQNSSLQSISKWTAYPNFLLLRPVGLSPTEIASIVAWAQGNLLDIPYNLTIGFLNAKYTPTPVSTHCAHLIWNAYRHFGHDLDGDGGLIITPADLAQSPLLEVVQSYGLPLIP